MRFLQMSTAVWNPLVYPTCPPAAAPERHGAPKVLWPPPLCISGSIGIWKGTRHQWLGSWDLYVWFLVSSGVYSEIWANKTCVKTLITLKILLYCYYSIFGSHTRTPDSCKSTSTCVDQKDLILEDISRTDLTGSRLYKSYFLGIERSNLESNSGF